jgi:hypothetical protein
MGYEPHKLRWILPRESWACCGGLHWFTVGGWRGACIAAFDPDLGEAPWLGLGYGTFPEVFRNRARPAIAAAGSDATMKRGLY